MLPVPFAALAPYVLPYVGFLLVLDVARLLPEAWRPWALPVQVAVPGLLWLGFLAGGAYPELRGGRARARGVAADVALGLAIAVLWTAPYALLPWLPRPAAESGFDPQMLGASHQALAVALRGLGYVVVTPFVEELFVRGLLWRWIAAGLDGDFRSVPPAAPVLRSAVGTTLVFTLTHVPWEWPVALPTGALLAWWLMRRGHLNACVRAHAVANGALFALALLDPARFAVFL